MVPPMGSFLPAIALYLMFVFSTTCHEAAHAWAAKRGGDDTAHQHGHVTLDPIPHIVRSPFGMVVLPLIGVFTMGYPLGFASVPFDPHWGRRYPLRQAAMSLAGPLANFTLALTSIVILRILIGFDVFHLFGAGARVGFVFLGEGIAPNSPLAALAFVLSHLFTLNLILGAFNLVPLPPLDGSGVLEGIAPRTIGKFYDYLREIPAHGILGWIVASQLFRYLDGPLNRVIVLALGI
jgi:Zn-dependent protease